MTGLSGWMVEGLMRRLTTKKKNLVKILGADAYTFGDGYEIYDPTLGVKRKLNAAERKFMILQIFAGRDDVVPSHVDPGALMEYSFRDPRIVMELTDDGPESVEIGLIGAAFGPKNNVKAGWNKSTGSWELSTFPTVSWKTFGWDVNDAGVEVKQYSSLVALDINLSMLANMNELDVPDPIVAAGDDRSWIDKLLQRSTSEVVS